MKNILVLLAFICTFSVFAQKAERKDKGIVYSLEAVDQKPEYRGGNAKLISDIRAALKDAGFESAKLSRVGLVFVVEKDGSLNEVQVLNAPDDATKDALSNILMNLPKFTSGKYKAKNVRVMYSVLLKEKSKLRELELLGPMKD